MSGRDYSVELRLAGFFPKRVVTAPDWLGSPAVTDIRSVSWPWATATASLAAAERFSIEKPEPGKYYVAEVLVEARGLTATPSSPFP